MLKDFRMPATGVVAAWLIAIHPWNIPVTRVKRGDTASSSLSSRFCLLFWRRAMMTGHWRWWSAYAFAQFSLFYCYPASAFILLVLNLVSLGLLRGRGNARSLGLRKPVAGFV